MGVSFQHGPVHERARIPFVGIADHILRAPVGGTGESPFPARRETCTASSTEPGPLHLIDHLLRAHGREGLSKGLVAVVCDVVSEVGGVDLPAVGEHPSMLLPVKGDIAGMYAEPSPLPLLPVEQPFNDLAAQDRSAHDLTRILRVDLLVEEAQRIDGHDRGPGAEAVASGLPDLHVVNQPLADHLFGEGIAHVCRTVCAASCHADADNGLVMIDPLNDPVADLLEPHDRLNPLHVPSPFSKARTASTRS